jgi:hypothetical protein
MDIPREMPKLNCECRAGALYAYDKKITLWKKAGRACEFECYSTPRKGLDAWLCKQKQMHTEAGPLSVVNKRGTNPATSPSPSGVFGLHGIAEASF